MGAACFMPYMWCFWCLVEKMYCIHQTSRSFSQKSVESDCTKYKVIVLLKHSILFMPLPLASSDLESTLVIYIKYWAGIPEVLIWTEKKMPEGMERYPIAPFRKYYCRSDGRWAHSWWSQDLQAVLPHGAARLLLEICQGCHKCHGAMNKGSGWGDAPFLRACVCGAPHSVRSVRPSDLKGWLALGFTGLQGGSRHDKFSRFLR